MKALVIDAPGEIAWRDQPEPEPGPDEVLVRSAFVGLCGTDLEILRGELEPGWVTYPCVPGHEWSGVVEALGEGVDDLARGDHVACEGRIPCNRCARCEQGATNLCLHYDQLGFTRPGGAAELVCVPRFVVHRLPADVPLDAAVMIEPAASLARAMSRAQLAPGETIGVIGIGSLGAAGILLAGLRAPQALVGYGIRPAELELATRLGASATIDVGAGDPLAATEALVPGGLDVVVETAGATAAIELATRLARPGGRVILLGLAGAGREVTLPADRFPNKDLTVHGLASYDRSAWSTAVGLVRDGLIDFSPVLGRRFAIERFDEAYATLGAGGGVGKLLLVHEAAVGA
jgi:L-iditol 2-dehydrogenase